MNKNVNTHNQMPIAQFQKMFITVIADTVHLCVFVGVISEDDQVDPRNLSYQTRRKNLPTTYLQSAVLMIQ